MFPCFFIGDNRLALYVYFLKKLGYNLGCSGDEAQLPRRGLQQWLRARTEKFNNGKYKFFNYTKSVHLPKGPMAHMATSRMDMSMQASILSRLTRPLRTVKQQVNVQCPRSSCTWPEFETGRRLWGGVKIIFENCERGIGGKYYSVCPAGRSFSS